MVIATSMTIWREMPLLFVPLRSTSDRSHKPKTHLKSLFFSQTCLCYYPPIHSLLYSLHDSISVKIQYKEHTLVSKLHICQKYSQILHVRALECPQSTTGTYTVPYIKAMKIL